MPKFSINHRCDLSADEAYSKIKTFFETDPDIQRFGPQMKCEFLDLKKTGKAVGSQFKADIAVSVHEGGSLVNVVVELPFLLTPFKGKVQDTIEKKLNKYLA